MNLSNFSDRLNYLLFDAHISTAEFGKAIGIGRTTAFELMKGTREPTLDTIVRIADYFHCYVDYLVGLEAEYFKFPNPKPCPPFKDRIPAICEHFGISRYRLVLTTKVARTNIHNWARGATVPTVDNLVKMAEALGCSVDFLIGRD